MDIFEYSVKFLSAPLVIFCFLFFFQRKFSAQPLNTIADWLNTRGVFTSSNGSADQVVIDFARILLGLILLYRLYYIWVFVVPLSPNANEYISLILYLTLCITLTLGVLAPLSALMMLLFQLHFNFTLQTYTLGNDVVAMILLCFVLYPVGRLFSIDALIAKKHSWINGFYRFFEYGNRNTQATLAKAISFYSYCLLCIYSVVLHLNEPLWMNGEAAVHLFSSSYLSRYSVFFQQLFSTSAIAVIIAKASMIGMVAWYFLLGPAILVGGLLRKLAILWALAFFFVSAFILQLSVLPYIEFMILFIWFWNLFPAKEARSLNMLYDDRCNLCDRTVRTLRILDLHHVIHFRPVSQNLDYAKVVKVSQDELYKNLYSWDRGSERVYAGYEFYLHLCRRVLLLMPFYPILLLFKYLLVGPLIYKTVAAYRIRWFGVCRLPTNTKVEVSSALLETSFDKKDNSAIEKTFFRPFLQTSFLLSFIFLSIMPGSPTQANITKHWPEIIRSAHIFSWTRINVFNREDLGMSQHFFTVYAIRKTGDELLPLTGADGSRLDWHKSDRAYFGNTLRWRRWKNTRDLLPATKNDKNKFCEIVKWAQSNQIYSDLGYRFDFHQSDWPHENNGVFVYPSFDTVGSLVVSPSECVE